MIYLTRDRILLYAFSCRTFKVILINGFENKTKKELVTFTCTEDTLTAKQDVSLEMKGWQNGLTESCVLTEY